MLHIERRFTLILSLLGFAVRTIKGDRRILACRLNSNFNLQIIGYCCAGRRTHFDKDLSVFHLLLYPHRDCLGAYLLISHNAGWRPMMVMRLHTEAAHKQKAHKAAEKICAVPNPHPWETGTHG